MGGSGSTGPSLESVFGVAATDDGAAPRGRGPRIASGCRIALDAAHGVAFLLFDFPAEAIAFDLETADRIVLGR